MKKERVCSDCGKKILKSEICLTTNKQGEGRKWHCMNCASFMSHSKERIVKCSTLQTVMSLLSGRGTVAFGDEGAFLAYDDAIAEEISQNCEDCPDADSCRVGRFEL